MGTGSRWYKLPLVAGNHIPTDRGTIVQDGFIASFQVFLLLLCFGFAITVGAWMTHEHPRGIRMACLHTTLVVYMLVACVLIFLMYRFRIGRARRRHTSLDLPSTLTVSDRLRRVIKEKLPLVGIVCFFIPSIFLDLFTLAAYIDCTPDVLVCGAQVIFTYLSNIVFHVFRMAYMGTLVAFAMFFHRKRFTTKVVTIRYILMFILASTLVMWFETFVNDFSHVFLTQVLSNGTSSDVVMSQLRLEDVCRLNHSLSTATASCLARNTTQFHFLNNMQPFFYPLNIEFALLVTEIVAHLFFSFKARGPRQGGAVLGEYVDTCLGEDDVATHDDDDDHGDDDDEQETHIKRVRSSEAPALPTDDHHMQADSGDSLMEDGAGAEVSLQPDDLEGGLKPADMESGLRARDLDVGPSCLPSSKPEDLLSSSPRRSSLRRPRAATDRRPRHGVRIIQPSARPGDTFPDPGHERRPLLLDLSETPARRGASPATQGRRGYGSRELRQHVQSPPSPGDSSFAVASTESTASTRSVNERRARLYCSVISGIIVNAILFTMVLLDFFQVDSPSFLVIYHVYCVGYYVLFICWVYSALKKCENFISRFQPYTGLELIVVVSGAGFHLHSIMSIMAYTADLGRETTTMGRLILGLSFMEKVLDMYCLFVQTPFMLHATRIEAPVGYEKERNSLKQCLMFVAVSNIFIWTIDSFIEIKNLETVDPSQMKYYGAMQWSFVTHIILPFLIFYRFNSFFILLGGFLDH